MNNDCTVTSSNHSFIFTDYRTNTPDVSFKTFTICPLATLNLTTDPTSTPNRFNSARTLGVGHLNSNLAPANFVQRDLTRETSILVTLKLRRQLHLFRHLPLLASNSFWLNFLLLISWEAVEQIQVYINKNSCSRALPKDVQTDDALLVRIL